MQYFCKRNMKRRIFLFHLTCCKAQYLAARCDRMAREAYLLHRTLQDPIASCNQTRIALPKDWLS